MIEQATTYCFDCQQPHAPKACPKAKGEERRAPVITRADLEAERRKWLTIEEAAYVLRTSRDVLFRLVHTNKLPLLKEGKVMRVHVDDLNACRQTMGEWHAHELNMVERRKA